MHLGKLTGAAAPTELLVNRNHPYTKALISAALPVNPWMQGEKTVLSGEAASSFNLPSGRYFHPSCPHVLDRCSTEVLECLEIYPGNEAVHES
jgi:oligopeptide/dipeptide ABC transporter ATP-binding protein